MKNNIILETLSFILKRAWTKKKSIYGCYIIKFFANYMNQISWILIPKFIIDQLLLIINGASVEQHLKTAFMYVGLLSGLRLIGIVLEQFSYHKKEYLAEWFREDFELDTADYVMKMDFEHTENPEVLNQMNKANEGISWYSGGVTGILDSFYDIFYNIVMILSVCVIVIKTCPLLLPIQLGALVIMTFLNHYKNKIGIAFFTKLSSINRVFSYVLFNLASFQYGKDVRLYNSQKMFSDKSEEQTKLLVNNTKKRNRKEMFFDYVFNTINAIRDGASYFYIAMLAIKKIITIGDFTMCSTSATTLYQGLTGCTWGVQKIIQRCTYMSEYIKFIKYPEAIRKGTKSIQPGNHTIEFNNVCFKYPRAQDYTLQNINIKIEQGEHIAVVGLNGAGKTTFIKLLCRLYDVTEGEILIDGINIKDYSNLEYRKLLSVVFQDFKLFAFTLKENIVFDKEETDENINKILKDSGLYDDVQKLPKKLNTLMYKSFEKDGVELSGGQQQKLALCRTLYKDSPIVILDEPTAALDPIAEAEVYNNFSKLVGSRTAVYISHRLSSCKFCDKIVVFNNKTISEYGTHEELIQKNGVYATMFHTQAKHYLENPNNT